MDIVDEERATIENSKTLFKLNLPEIDNVRWNSFGVQIENRRVSGIGFYNKILNHYPTEISAFKQLRILALTGTQIKNLSPSIGDLEYLEELYLGGNQFTQIPKEIGRLKKLKYLYLLEDNLQSIPNSLIHLESLVELSIQTRQLKIKPSILNQIEKNGSKVYFNTD